MNTYIFIAIVLIISGSIVIGKAHEKNEVPLMGFISVICGLSVLSNNYGLF